MPDDRLFHPRLRGSAKVSALTYLERCVWEDMVLGSDDYGVIPYRPAKLRADNDRFAQHETDLSIQAAMDQVIAVGLFVRFDHQGQQFACDPLWQDFQKVRYPRRSYYPIPTPEVFPKLSRNTSGLFKKRLHPLKRAGHRLTANGLRLEANGQRQGESEGAKTPAVQFQIPDSVQQALSRAPVLGAVVRLKDPRWWQAQVRANGRRGIDFAAEILKAEAWIATNPERAPRKNQARFLHTWLARAEGVNA